MSKKVVEERVVEMQFDNKQFESNVKESMSTIERLKQKLRFEGATKGLETLNKTVKKVDLTGLSSSADAVAVKFSAMQVAATTAMANITNSAIQTGRRVVKAFTLDPILTGFSEYETQINAVQTILANTQHEGATLDQVNAALNELNKYADQTIYNFTEMTRNIGTFTAAGTGLNKSVTAIKGIANLAAVSGSTSQQASTAMYQLSQALAAGKVQLMDWNSVVNAGMGGKVFQDALKRTAANFGYNVDEMIEKWGSFRETLSREGWLTADVLTETLTQISGAYTEADLIAQGYTEQQAKDIVQLAETAVDAATKVKTFSQLYDTLKEAAQSGWTQTWQLIVGDFEEAKSTLTEFSEYFGNIINASSEARNALLKGALASKWSQVMEKLTIKTEDFNAELQLSAKYAGYNVDAMVKEYGSVEAALQKGAISSDIFRNTIHRMSIYQLENVGYTEEQAKAIRRLAYEAENADSPISKLIEDIAKPSGRELLFDSLKNSLKGVTKLFGAVKNAWADVFPPATSEQIYAIIENLNKFTKSLIMSDDTADKVTRTLRGLFSILDIVTTLAGGGFKLAFKLANGFLDLFGTNLLDVTANIGDLIYEARQFFTIKNLIEEFTYVLEEFFGVGEDTIEGFKKGLKDGITSIPEIMVDIVTGLINKAKELLGIHSPSTVMFDIGKNTLLGFIDGIKSVASTLLGLIKTVINMVINFIKDADLSSVISIGISAGLLYTVKKLVGAVETLAAPLEGFGDLLSGVGSALTNFGKGFKKWGASKLWEARANALRSFALAIVVLVGALYLLSVMDEDKLKKSLFAMAALAGILAVLSASIGQFGGKGAISFAGFSASLVAISAAILIMSASLKVLSSIDTTAAFQAVGMMALIIGGMVAFIKGFSMLSNADGPLKGAGRTLLTMTLSIALMVGVIKLASMLRLEDVLYGLSVVAAFALFIKGLVYAMSYGKDTQIAKIGGTLIAITVALGLMVVVMKLIGTLTLGEFLKGVGVVAAYLLFVGALVSILKAGKEQDIIKVGGTLIAVSAAILLMTAAIFLASRLSPESLKKGIAAVGAFTVFMAAFIQVTKLGKGKQIAKASTTLIAMSVAVGILAGVTLLLGLISVPHLKKGIVAVGILSAIMAGLVVATKFSKNAKDEILFMTVAVAVLAASVAALSFIKPEKLMSAATALGILMGMFAVMTQSLSLVQTSMKSILTVIGVVALLAGVVALLSLIPVGDTIGITVSLSALLLSMSASMMILSKVGSVAPKAYLALGAMLLVVGGLAAIIYALSGIETDSAMEIAGALSVLLISMSGVALLMGGLGAIGPVALKGALIFDGVVLAIGGLIAGIGALATYFPQLETFINKGVPLLEAIGTGIGSFFGGIVGGFMSGITSELPGIADDLSLFMMKLTPFLMGVKMVDVSAAEGIKTIAEMILILTAADILSGIADWITGGVDITDFAEQLEPFGEGIKSFASAIAGVDGDLVSKAAMAGKALAEMAAAIPNTGGLVSFFTGENDMKKFSEGLVSFGTAITMFSLSVALVNPEAVKAAAEAGTAIAKMASEIPNTGGLVSFFTGENDMQEFAKGLVPFGVAISMFSMAVTGVKTEAVKAATDAGVAIAEMAAKIPNTGGLVSLFTGENDMGTFGGRLASFGRAIVGFGNQVQYLKPEAVKAAAEAGTALAKMASEIPNMGGLVSFFTGDNDLTSFADQLGDFGHGLATFGYHTAGLNAEAVKNAAGASKDLIDVMKSLPKNKTFTNETWLDEFGEMLADFGPSFKEYYDSIAGIDIDKLSAATIEISKVVSVTKSIAGMDVSKTSTFANALIDLGQNGVAGFVEAFKTANDEIDTAVGKLMLSVIEAISKRKDQVNKTFETLLSNVSKTVANQYPKFEYAGKQIVLGLIQGMAKENYKAVWQAQKLAESVRTTVETALDINSPSRIFYTIGGYVVQGLGNGIKAMGYYAVKASEKLAGDILDGFKDPLDINSPSGVTRDKVGKPIVQGIAEGITEDMSAEEAAEKKAQNIVDTFQKEFDKVDLNLNTSDLTYELWTKKNEYTATDVQKSTKELENINNQIMFQNEKTKLAQEEYQVTLDTFGEQSEKTQEAYNKLLQEQIDLADLHNQYTELTKELTETQQTQVETNQAAFEKYAEFIQQNKDNVLALGVSLEELKKVAAQRTGYNPDLDTQTMNNQVAGTVTNAMNTVEQTYSNTAQSTFGSLTANFAQWGTTYANALGSGLQNGVTNITSVVNKIAESCAQAIAAKEEEFYNLGHRLGSKFASGFKAALDYLLDRLQAEANENAPVITPVMDLSQVGTGLSQMGSLISGATTGMEIAAKVREGFEAKKTAVSEGTSSNASGISKSIVNNFTQNNYSPKALSRLDIYRQTKNQLATVKKVVDEK